MVIMRLIAAAVMFAVLAGCSAQNSEEAATPFLLPEPITNNAVAVADGPNGPTLYSFNGLKAGKSWRDTSNAAFACPIEQRKCTPLPSVPGDEGRLASAAITIKGKIYIFGGYSVAQDGSEKSLPYAHRFDPMTQSYSRLEDMPVPVDDMVIFGHQGRYIYLVSGWHDVGNVALVQIFDTQSDTWSRGTDYPGTPVFGHAGGNFDGVIVIADGVKVLPKRAANGSRYAASDEIWRGQINPSDPQDIKWQKIKRPATAPFYRMAAAGHAPSGHILFAGGGDNPYNYNGIGYDTVPAKPTAQILGYDVASGKWATFADLPMASMDHRALVFSGSTAYIMGGMDAGQNVRAEIMEFIPQQDDAGAGD
ncbi:Kelch repeat-containing protein [Parasphingorhabdus sp. DH2-15]|uniref:Kelch repeat-containing protein n=1 Tax=Parasphingorhabdus sp. DH2-15 TaxID=3444112 RepID=UPI003F6845AC